MYFDVCLAGNNISMRNKLVQAVELWWIIVIVRSELYERIGDSVSSDDIISNEERTIIIILRYLIDENKR